MVYLESDLINQVSPNNKQLCMHALEYLEKAKDLGHNHTHPFRMLKNLELYLSDNPDMATAINLDVLVVAICWHDIYKSDHLPKNIMHLISEQWSEGKKSAQIFKKYYLESTSKPNMKFLDEVFYCIRKHSLFQFLPSQTIESKLLQDLDHLELYSPDRLHLQTDYWLDNLPSKPGVVNIITMLNLRYLKYTYKFHFKYKWFVKKAKNDLEAFIPTLVSFNKQYTEKYISVSD